MTPRNCAHYCIILSNDYCVDLNQAGRRSRKLMRKSGMMHISFVYPEHSILQMRVIACS